MEGFQYAVSLDLDIGYYHIQISDDATNLCTIILFGEGYCLKRLSMGVSKSSDIFQQKMNGLIHGFEFIHAYIYYLFNNKSILDISCE